MSTSLGNQSSPLSPAALRARLVPPSEAVTHSAVSRVFRFPISGSAATSTSATTRTAR
jgi:hypothetical protein